jgi:hypothetical protein
VGFVETVAGIDGGNDKTAFLGGKLEKGSREGYFVGEKLGKVFGMAVGDAVFKAVDCTDGV